MKHASEAILRRLRWLYMAYCAQFIGGYVYAVLALHTGLQGSVTFSALLAGLAGVVLLYELIASFTLYRKRAWMASVISVAAALILTTIVLEFTGVYLSPYCVVVIGLTFAAGATAQYFPTAIWSIFLIGFLFSLAGVFKSRDGGPIAGLIFLAVESVAVGTSFAFWRRFYIQSSTPELENLSRSLKNTQVQSNIVLQSIADGVVLIDSQQIIRLFNPAAAATMGWNREEAEGLDWRSVFIFVDAKDTPLETSIIDTVFKNGETVRQNDVHLLTKSSKNLTIALTVSPLLDDSKQVTGAVGIFRDVSEERQQEAQRAEFISTASHEMRTPVAAIEGYLSLALNDKVATIDARARDYLEKAHTSTTHLGQLFQDLLTSAKAEDGRLTSHPKVIEIGAYLEQLTQDLRFTAQKKNLAVEFLIGNTGVIDASTPVQLGSDKVIRPLYYTTADPDRLREVITNLFDNACKYTDAGKISLGLTGNDSVVQLYIRDTGAGIPPEDIPHLFQKFYRVDNSATRTIGGTGLGLFISRKIIELYQGRIWVESSLGKGSTFYINLPRLSTQKAEQQMAQEANVAVQSVGALAAPTPPIVPASPAS